MKRFTFLVIVAALFMNVGFAQSFTPAKDAKALTHRAVGKRTQSPLKTSGLKQSSAELGIAKENWTLPERKPAQTSALPIPVALPATNVSDVYFEANWEAVSGVDAYQVEVYRTFETTVDTTIIVLAEDFLFAESQEGEYSGYLDYYCYRADWYLMNGFVGDRSIVLPKESSEGWSQLETPYLDLNGMEDSDSTLVMNLIAKGAINDKLILGYYYYENDEDVYPVDVTLGTLTFEDTVIVANIPLKEIPLRPDVVFYLCTDSEMFVNSDDITIYSVVIAQPVPAGTELYRFHDYKQTDKSPVPFFTMEKNTDAVNVTDKFEYLVYSFVLDDSGYYIADYSDPSNMIEVEVSNAVEGLKAVNEKIFVHDNLHVVLEKPTAINVYNMAGVLVVSCQGVEGDNEIALPSSGAYIVKAGNTVAKVMK